MQSGGGPHTTELARKAAEDEYDVLLIAGGDGSVGHSVAGLLGSNTALGVLPAGTANVWARELGLDGLSWARWTALEESARRLVNGKFQEVDVGTCNGIPFLLWAGVGFDAFIVHRMEPRSRWEKHFAVAQYAANAVLQLGEFSGINLKAYADDNYIEGQFLLSVVSNIHLYAGGYAKISPYALLDDGLMDLWLFTGTSTTEILRHLVNLLSGRHVQSDQVIHVPFKRLVLESDSRLYVQLDGEPVEAGGSVTIEVKEKALRVLVPSHPSASLFKEE